MINVTHCRVCGRPQSDPIHLPGAQETYGIGDTTTPHEFQGVEWSPTTSRRDLIILALLIALSFWVVVSFPQQMFMITLIAAIVAGAAFIINRVRGR